MDKILLKIAFAVSMLGCEAIECAHVTLLSIFRHVFFDVKFQIAYRHL